MRFGTSEEKCAAARQIRVIRLVGDDVYVANYFAAHGITGDVCAELTARSAVVRERAISLLRVNLVQYRLYHEKTQQQGANEVELRDAWESVITDLMRRYQDERAELITACLRARVSVPDRVIEEDWDY